jgi:hypothetical protein
MWFAFDDMLYEWFRRRDRDRQLMGHCRNETSDDATVPCPSEEEETSCESVLRSIPFGDGLRYRRFAIPSWTIQPANWVVAMFLDLSNDLRDNMLTSAWVTPGHVSATTVRCVGNRCEYLVDI